MIRKKVEGDTSTKRRRQVRLRLRTLIRMVIVNKSWLRGVEEEKITTNTKKNIALLLRQKRKFGILTMADKSLIRMPVWKRTDEDKKKLVNLMLNLTCFAKFPPKVRARLSRVVKFNLVAPGRAIIREGGEALAVYFILTGEVEVTKTVYNMETKVYEDKLVYVIGPGDCFGDVELVSGCVRTNTCKARNDVELLIVYDDDFHEILRPFLEKQWEEKRAAVASFDYFKNWTYHQTVFLCKFGLLRQYEPLETIYYEDKGPLDYVHFVISGECMILQYLKMKVKKQGNEKRYSLVDIANERSKFLFSKEDEEHAYNLSKFDVKTLDDDISVHSKDDMDEDVPGVYKKGRLSDFKRYAKSCAVDLGESNKDEVQILDEINRRRFATTYASKTVLFVRSEFESHFVDAGSLFHGAIFGLGEKLEHRVIMARTTVQCLLIPRYWLFGKDQNPGNVWQRTLIYLESTLPSRELLFKDFLKTRKWQQYKKELIDKTLDSNAVGNPTKLQDIPIICRIVEDVHNS